MVPREPLPQYLVVQGDVVGFYLTLMEGEESGVDVVAPLLLDLLGTHTEGGQEAQEDMALVDPQ